jgi:hypothetical protein
VKLGLVVLALLGYGYSLVDTTRRYERNGLMIILDTLVAPDIHGAPLLSKG